MTAKKMEAKTAPKAMPFLPAALVVCCVGEAVALALLFDDPVRATVAPAAVPVATPAFPMVGAPVTRTAAPVELPVA